jgi:predicted regulator of Ras-like GTPase activity (Roadblock/LC7/MglB family)
MDMVSYTFLDEELERLSLVLENFVNNVGVDVCVLCDDGGRLITFAPKLESLKPISHRSAVISAAINGALEYLENFVDRGKVLYVSGNSKSVYMLKSENSFILFVSFSNKIPLGSVKLFSERLMNEINPILEVARNRQSEKRTIKFEDIAI